MPGQSWWGAGQWAAFLEYKEQPIRAASKAALDALEAGAEDTLSAHAYAALLLEDPLLALRLLARVASEFGVVVEPMIRSTALSLISFFTFLTAVVVSDASSSTM